MNVLLASQPGFSAGVEMAVEILYESFSFVAPSKQQSHPDSCLASSVHNSRKNKAQPNSNQSRGG
jgi:4-hydroxy-3-methylbut-2-enyl diphosphate reductase IspH